MQRQKNTRSFRMPGELGMPQDDAVSNLYKCVPLGEINQSISSSEQAPGPLGSPHVPQGPGSAANADVLSPPLTANREICWSSFLLSHFGQAACCEPNTMLSKR